MNVIQWDGKPISKPGIYAGIPLETYHGATICAGPSISSSGLRTIFKKSPAHYWASSPYNPAAIEREDSEAMILGRAAHHALLGESEFSKHYVIRPEMLAGKAWQGNRTDCKEWLAAAAESGLTVLTPAQRDQIVGMRAGLAAHPMIDPKGGVRLLDGYVEHSIIWRDAETGIWLKVRPDVIPAGSDDVADLKTAADVSDDAIERTVGDFGLNQQGGLVAAAWREVIGRAMASFSLVFVEKTAPHIARVMTIKPHDLDLGERQNRAALRMFAKCMASGRWPGPGGEQTDASYVEMKPWARTQAEARLSTLEHELEAA